MEAETDNTPVFSINDQGSELRRQQIIDKTRRREVFIDGTLVTRVKEDGTAATSDGELVLLVVTPNVRLEVAPMLVKDEVAMVPLRMRYVVEMINVLLKPMRRICVDTRTQHTTKKQRRLVHKKMESLNYKTTRELTLGYLKQEFSVGGSELNQIRWKLVLQERAA